MTEVDKIAAALDNHTNKILSKNKPGRKRSQDSYRKMFEAALLKEAKMEDKAIKDSQKESSPKRNSNVTPDTIKIWKLSLIQGYELFSKLDFIERHKIEELFLTDVETIQWYTIGSTWDSEYKPYKTGIEILFKKSYKHVSNLIDSGCGINCSMCKNNYNYSFDSITNINYLTCSSCDHTLKY
tara:strand:- start:6168 stop:6716 length:549 start_codon:yes stop_codon:yes gene_type:complete